MGGAGGLGARMRALIDAGFAPSAAFAAFCARCAQPEAEAVSMPAEQRPAAGASRRTARRLAAEFDLACAEARAARAGFEGERLIAAALGLWRVSPQARCARAVAGRLRFATRWRERAQAAFALAQMPCVESEEALYEALTDGDARVRHCAARALLVFHGVALDARAGDGLARLAPDAEPTPR